MEGRREVTNGSPSGELLGPSQKNNGLGVGGGWGCSLCPMRSGVRCHCLSSCHLNGRCQQCQAHEVRPVCMYLYTYKLSLQFSRENIPWASSKLKTFQKENSQKCSSAQTNQFCSKLPEDRMKRKAYSLPETKRNFSLFPLLHFFGLPSYHPACLANCYLVTCHGVRYRVANSQTHGFTKKSSIREMKAMSRFLDFRKFGYMYLYHLGKENVSYTHYKVITWATNRSLGPPH